MSTNSQPTPLVVGQPETSSLQLLAENAILFNQVRHRVLLAPIQPAKYRREHEAERKFVDHGGRVYDIDRSPVVLGAWAKAWDTTRLTYPRRGRTLDVT
jgi:hypothetical protein